MSCARFSTESRYARRKSHLHLLTYIRPQEKQVKKDAIVEPRFFKLATNFRSQAGIVICGQSILQLIGQVWPTSIDQLPKEMNMQAGVRPLFFRDGQIGMDNLSLSSRWVDYVFYDRGRGLMT